MTELPNESKMDKPEPFTEDETMMGKMGNTTYIINIKYKKGAREGVMDKLLRLIENYDEKVD